MEEKWKMLVEEHQRGNVSGNVSNSLPVIHDIIEFLLFLKNDWKLLFATEQSDSLHNFYQKRCESSYRERLHGFDTTFED